MNVFFKAYCRAFQLVFYVAQPLLPYRDPQTRSSIDDIPSILKIKGYKRVLIVTDEQLVKLGIAKMVENVLQDAGIEYVTYSEVVPNPTIDNVESARKAYLDFGAQAIIALGGGSAMDCAKAAGARVARPGLTIPQMRGILKIWRKLPMLIAIPTTAGTGSEATLAMVITDAVKKYKYPCNDFGLIPPYAIHDYRLTTGLPPFITATTGMDALTHAVEAYIGGSITRSTEKKAELAVSLINKYLYRAYTNGEDAEARQNMLTASFYAGLSFSKSYVGYVHAVAHSLGGKYGTPHGLANAVLLPIVLREYGSVVYKKLAKLARNAGVVEKGKSDEQTALMFIDWIQDLNDKMQIPRNLPDINEQDIPEMAAYANAEANPLYPVPVLMDKKELEKLYLLGKNGNA